MINELKQLRELTEELVTKDEQLNSRIKEEKDQLKKEVDKFRFLYEESPMLYQSLNHDGIVLEVNKKWISTLGYDKEDVIGKPIKLFLDSSWPENKYYFSFEYLDKSINVGEVRPKFMHKDGHVVDMVIDGRIIHEFEGLGKQTHCILHEFTDRNNK